jgi:transcriptional regulator with XRE-family HTH domain
MEFAERLREAMQREGLNASDVARRVWGEIQDKRGYYVARNRDRIGFYLAGVSFPEDENLRKLAEAVGLSYEALAVTNLRGSGGDETECRSLVVVDLGRRLRWQQTPRHARHAVSDPVEQACGAGAEAGNETRHRVKNNRVAESRR